jgi:hypothetical protein
VHFEGPGGNPAPIYHKGVWYATSQSTREVLTLGPAGKLGDKWAHFADITPHLDHGTQEDPFMCVSDAGACALFMSALARGPRHLERFVHVGGCAVQLGYIALCTIHFALLAPLQLPFFFILTFTSFYFLFTTFSLELAFFCTLPFAFCTLKPLHFAL